MIKKLAVLALIMAIVLMLGCTGKDQSSSGTQSTATDQPTDQQAQQTIAPAPSDISPTQADATAGDNSSTPEMDLPMPTDLSNI